MSEFIFDEERHCYTLSGIPLVSVTRVIKPLYNFSAVPAYVLEKAAAYGTAVHKTVELYLKNDLDEDSLDDGLRGPLEAFKRWHDDHPSFQGRVPDIETPRYHSRLKYAGTPDLVYPDIAVIDIKSRAVNLLTDPIQLAAYDHFGMGKRERFVLELLQDGSYRFTLVNPTQAKSNEAWKRFRFLLDHYNNQKEIERWKL